MLSKVKHFNNQYLFSTKVDTAKLVSALVDDLKKQIDKVTIEETTQVGTLGVFFTIYINGNKKFVKTHLKGDEYRKNLIKEIDILITLYSDMLSIERKDIFIEDFNYTFLIMDFLDKPISTIDIDIIESCIKNYNQRLGNLDSYKNVDLNYSIEDVIKEGFHSLNILNDSGMITKNMKNQCEDAIHGIELNINNFVPMVCHGDLSNANILQLDGNLIVIDWEDALFAFENYDFLYWLTFYTQRKYYSKSLLCNRNIDLNWAKSVMALIVTVKSALSYTRGNYLGNSIPFEDRLLEIFQISDY